MSKVVVYFIEDEAAVREVMIKYFAILLSETIRLNSEFIFFSNATEANARKRRDGWPDVVVCDHGLPNQSGADLLREWRSAEWHGSFLLYSGGNCPMNDEELAGLDASFRIKNDPRRLTDWVETTVRCLMP